MNKWLILHHNSRFSSILSSVLGHHAECIHIDELVNQVAVKVQMDHTVNHRWVFSGQLIDDFYQRVIFQEVFFDVDSALYQYDDRDKAYVKFSWQAYLLSLFSYSKTVINPVTPQNLSISHYQFPRLLGLAKEIGFRVPGYEVGRGAKAGYVAVDSLWYWPGRDSQGISIMNVEKIAGEGCMVRFVRYDDRYMVCWPKIPKIESERLLRLCNQLGVYVGEAFFTIKDDWFFYGIRPQIQTEGCSDKVLWEIAECLRDIGNEVIV